MQILFLHENRPDYLAESLFHGLRSLSGDSCVDIPRYDGMYLPVSEKLRAKLRGGGFSLYGLLPEEPSLADDRFFWQSELEKYDLFVIASVWHQYALLSWLMDRVPAEKIAVLDGLDRPHIFPAALRLRSHPSAYFTKLSGIFYFKRELGAFGRSPGELIGRVGAVTTHARCKIRPISFSIPAEKIRRGDVSNKSKTFPRHIVDSELSAVIKDSIGSKIGESNYAFLNEDDYYSDLSSSYFGITQKRGGWDCLRHYEIAAAGAVMCFRDLYGKPETWRFGLNATNCVVYKSSTDLFEKIASIDQAEYSRLLMATHEWAMANSTRTRASEFICTIFGGSRLPTAKGISLGCEIVNDRRDVKYS